MGRDEFDLQARRAAPSTSGSRTRLATKIAATARALQLSRSDMKYSAGQLPHELLMRSIELYT